jgi:ribosome assembly protein YihI (activator of Der GTPase)
MPIKILLQLGPEKISTLENAGYSFSHTQKDQLQSFPTGWGMILSHGEWWWPIQWCGAHCGLGIGDIPWRDRYGRTAGFRVASRSTTEKPFYNVDGDLVGDRSPDIGEWYLSPMDVLAAGGFEEALDTRRKDTVESDLALEAVNIDATRNLELLSKQDHRQRLLQRIRDQHEFPQELEGWLDYDLDRVDDLLDVLRAVERGYPSSYADIANLLDTSKGSISNHFNKGSEPLRGVVVKRGEFYELSQAGRKAMAFPWREYLD